MLQNIFCKSFSQPHLTTKAMKSMTIRKVGVDSGTRVMLPECKRDF